jgi:hypothetical protein
MRWLMLLVALAALGILLEIAPHHDAVTAAGTTPTTHAPRGHVVHPRHSGSPTSARGDGTGQLERPAATAAVAPVPVDVPSTNAELASTGGASIPGSTTTTAAAAPVRAATVAPATSTFEGWLSGPMSVSASYPVAMPAPGDATATWTTGSQLTLQATCGTTTDEVTGSSGLRVVLGAADCTVTLSGPADVPTTSFSIVVGAS